MKRSELTIEELNNLKEISVQIIYELKKSYIIVQTCEFKLSYYSNLYGALISSSNDDVALTTYVNNWSNIPDDDDEIIKKIMDLDIDAVYMIGERELGIYLNDIYYCFDQIMEIIDAKKAGK